MGDDVVFERRESEEVSLSTSLLPWLYFVRVSKRIIEKIEWSEGARGQGTSVEGSKLNVN